ncbi:MAG: GerW family sporulation protein [Clostridium sp.]|nr:GerW family sporulation protein [Clostridium sp.]MCM1398023.1 GerW family sporulation protein [Clostridium sp.]MCM1459341.1 GerW family sporulation protein [Bacteroides sp.]
MANDFNETVGSLFKGMDTFLSSKTVVGEPTHIGDTIILPLVDVNFGVAAGAFAKDGNKNSAGGGMGGKMSPSAVLVIQNGRAKMISVKNEDTVSKIMDMIPDIIDKISTLVKKGEVNDKDAAIEEAINDIAKDELI